MSENYLDLIRYEGPNDVLVWKSDIQDFNAKSRLIVNESQEALFYKDGQALDLFPAGAHALNSDNLPFLRRLFAKFFKEKTPFPCQVFFINKVQVLDLLWGTREPIPVEDPKYGITIGVCAHGQAGVRIADSRKFVVNIVGQMQKYTVEEMRSILKGMIMTILKSLIAQVIMYRKIGIHSISAHLLDLSREVHALLREELAKLGLEAVNFFIESIAPEDGDLDAVRDAQNRRASRMIEGYTYQEERQFDVLEGAAKNTGAGTFAGAGIGLGMGFGLGGAFGSAAQGMSERINAAPQQAVTCPACRAQVPAGARFCQQCGATVEAQQQAVCAGCGQPLAADARFCANCGRAATTMQTCPTCDCVFEGPVKFCPYCGAKMQ